MKRQSVSVLRCVLAFLVAPVLKISAVCRQGDSNQGYTCQLQQQQLQRLPNQQASYGGYGQQNHIPQPKSTGFTYPASGQPTPLACGQVFCLNGGTCVLGLHVQQSYRAPVCLCPMPWAGYSCDMWVWFHGQPFPPVVQGSNQLAVMSGRLIPCSQWTYWHDARYGQKSGVYSQGGYGYDGSLPAATQCLNPATCVFDTFVGGALCICPTGRYGQWCEYSIDGRPRLQRQVGGNTQRRTSACTPSPCLNGGACREKETLVKLNNTTVHRSVGAHCECPACCEGLRCEKCSNPCRGVVCDCSRTDFTGALCQYKRSDNVCHSGQRVCRNGASCVAVNTPDVFRCTCAPGFYGNLCQFENSSCTQPAPFRCPSARPLCYTDSKGSPHCAAAWGDTPCALRSLAPCQNGGICAQGGGVQSTDRCICPWCHSKTL